MLRQQAINATLNFTDLLYNVEIICILCCRLRSIQTSIQTGQCSLCELVEAQQEFQNFAGCASFCPCSSCCENACGAPFSQNQNRSAHSRLQSSCSRGCRHRG
eukprot:4835-Pleurochrysis_carterae.AAC.5